MLAGGTARGDGSECDDGSPDERPTGVRVHRAQEHAQTAAIDEEPRAFDIGLSERATRRITLRQRVRPTAVLAGGRPAAAAAAQPRPRGCGVERKAAGPFGGCAVPAGSQVGPHARRWSLDLNIGRNSAEAQHVREHHAATPLDRLDARVVGHRAAHHRQSARAVHGVDA